MASPWPSLPEPPSLLRSGRRCGLLPAAKFCPEFASGPGVGIPGRGQGRLHPLWRWTCAGTGPPRAPLWPMGLLEFVSVQNQRPEAPEGPMTPLAPGAVTLLRGWRSLWGALGGRCAVSSQGASTGTHAPLYSRGCRRVTGSSLGIDWGAGRGRAGAVTGSQEPRRWWGRPCPGRCVWVHSCVCVWERLHLSDCALDMLSLLYLSFTSAKLLNFLECAFYRID